MEAKAIARYVRVSPRKARIVVDLIRGKSVRGRSGNPALHQPRCRRGRREDPELRRCKREHSNHAAAENLVVKKASSTKAPR